MATVLIVDGHSAIFGTQVKRHRVCVAGKDRAVRESVMASGAEAFSIPHFQDLLERSVADFRRKWGMPGS